MNQNMEETKANTDRLPRPRPDQNGAVESSATTARALWESLKKKYKTEDAGLKKFIVGKFLDFKMVDSKTVMNQVQEFQMILHDLHAEGMKLSESFQVAAMIEENGA
ncbi:UNVERIFIED_CONTAM: hypothetical protein Sradi_4834300 [Sesamum radiatum]|uniref:Uncharacterized protein n=1 Tax=Sesamum radiatum TaxID=300843 RepID=A0AAW2MXJ4_SESRA